MKFEFYISNKNNWHDLQAAISAELCVNLASGKDFFVEFKSEKTGKQMRSFWRLCGLIAPYFSESEGTLAGKETISEIVKREANYCRVVKGHLLTKSVADATRKEMRSLIDKLGELCSFYDIPNWELTGDEKKALNEYYNLK